MDGYVQAIRAATTMKKKSEWDKGGVRAIELSQEIKKALEEAAGTHSHPVLEAMHNMTKATDELVEKMRPIKERQQEINTIYAVFKEPENRDQLTPAERSQLKVEKVAELAAIRDSFYSRSKKSGDDANWARRCFRVTNSWAPNLFTYLEVPEMPSTNNSTEQEFGHIKTGLRRTTGRHNNPDLIYRHGDYIPLTLTVETLQELTERISSVSYSEYQQERERIRKKVAPLNMKNQVRRNTTEYLQGLNNKWTKIHPT